MRPNYFKFIGYLKLGGGEGGSSELPLDPPLLLWELIGSNDNLTFVFMHKKNSKKCLINRND